MRQTLLRRSNHLAIKVSFVLTVSLAQLKLQAAEFNPTIQAMGFGEIRYLVDEESKDDGVQLGQVVAHISSRFDQNTSAFGELTVTETEDGFKSEIERLIIRYDHSDLFKLSMGKYHTPIGYWNATYHHGAWLQTTIVRPRAFRFGSPIIPIHFEGLLLEGTQLINDVGVSYSAGVGHGIHQNLIAHEDEHNHKNSFRSDDALTLNVKFRPSWSNRSQLGLSYFKDKLKIPNDLNVTSSQYDNEITSVYYVYEGDSPEIIVEYLSFKNELREPREKSSGKAFYAQVGYRLKGRLNRWLPYFRYDEVDADESDVLIELDQNFLSKTVGIRYDFSEFMSLKTEYRSEEHLVSSEKNGLLQFQLSFVIQ